MTHGQLFAGIGGFGLAAEWVGWENVWANEIDPFCCKVLGKQFSKLEVYEQDIRELHPPRVDIITGGFPCQPFSVAGKRRGSADNRYLWPEMFRVIKEIKPRWVIAENVPGITSMEDIFEEICSSMEDIGYKVQTYIIPAGATGAIHGRNRVWILAYTEHNGHERRKRKNIEREISLPEVLFTRYKTGSLHEIEKEFISKPGVCVKYDGLPREVVRRELIALGNAIVPQVAYEIFKAIDTFTLNPRA